MIRPISHKRVFDICTMYWLLLLGLKRVILKMVVIKATKLTLLEILALADEKLTWKGQSVFTQIQKQVK